MSKPTASDPAQSIHVLRLRLGEQAAMSEAIRRLKPEAGGLAIEVEACRSFLSSERNVCVLATKGSDPVGYAVAYVLSRIDRSAPMILLYEVEVSPAYRRRGVGRALVNAVRDIARQAGACKMWTLADQGNAAALRLYASCGGLEPGENLLVVWPEDRLAPSHWRPDP